MSTPIRETVRSPLIRSRRVDSMWTRCRSHATASNRRADPTPRLAICVRCGKCGNGSGNGLVKLFAKQRVFSINFLDENVSPVGLSGWFILRTLQLIGCKLCKKKIQSLNSNNNWNSERKLPVLVAPDKCERTVRQ